MLEERDFVAYRLYIMTVKYWKHSKTGRFEHRIKTWHHSRASEYHVAKLELTGNSLDLEVIEVSLNLVYLLYLKVDTRDGTSPCNKLHRVNWPFLPQNLVAGLVPSCVPTLKVQAWVVREVHVKVLANEDTLLPTQMFPRLPARATFVARHKNVSDFVQKHFVSATNVSQFARARKRHEQQCFRNNVSSFATAFIQRIAWFVFYPLDSDLSDG